MAAESFQKLMVSGDLAKLSADERYQYYTQVCESIGLNPITQPLEYIVLNSKLRLYVKKDGTDQLRRIHGVSVDSLTHDYREALGLYVVTATGSVGNRRDTSTGAVNVKGLTGDALANSIMKAEAKSKRRLTLSLCGLGFLDETEIETIRSDEPPPDDAVPEKHELHKDIVEAIETVQIPEAYKAEVPALASTDEIKMWSKKLSALGATREKVVAYISAKYGVKKSTELTKIQLDTIFSDCLTAREKGEEQLTKLLESTS